MTVGSLLEYSWNTVKQSDTVYALVRHGWFYLVCCSAVKAAHFHDQCISFKWFGEWKSLRMHTLLNNDLCCTSKIHWCTALAKGTVSDRGTLTKLISRWSRDKSVSAALCAFVTLTWFIVQTLFKWERTVTVAYWISRIQALYQSLLFLSWLQMTSALDHSDQF